MNDASFQSYESLPQLLASAERVKRRTQQQQVGGNGYRITLGYEPVVVGDVEFRILKFLASRPYKAFTPARIVAAVSTPQQPVTIESLRDYILSLRDKLGMFSDYIQSVPYVGYRFKA